MNPYELLAEARKKVSILYPALKVNKKREILRLTYDIARIKKDPLFSFLPGSAANYEQLKRKLLKLRYPSIYNETPIKNFYLPNPSLDEKEEADISRELKPPKKIFYEKGAEYSKLFSRLSEKFTSASFIPISCIREAGDSISAPSYSLRSDNWVLIRQKSAFSKKCPCTKGCLSCGYFVLNLGFGCPFECSYCYLQGYQNINALILPYNLNDFFIEFDSKFAGLENTIRIGTGEFTDSLALDEYSGYAAELANFFSSRKNVLFELKTKSAATGGLLGIKSSSSVVVSFSLSPRSVSSKEEFLCADVGERIKAMKNLSSAGWPVAFHLDPIVYRPDFAELYRELFEEVFSSVSPEKIKWVSLGTFRFNPETAKMVERRFPRSSILDAEMILDFDGKLRYPFKVRKEIYLKILLMLKKFGLPLDRTYLCMENEAMWKELSIPAVFRW
ncbi:MAG: hypothetical protein Fur0012_12860 [Elusimicrobiota bacterium]